jgi:hypothetical protein
MKNTHDYTILKKSNTFQLVQRRKDKKKWYEIVYVSNRIVSIDAANRYFGVDRLTGSYNFRWKYKRLADADKKYTWALIKWS